MPVEYGRGVKDHRVTKDFEIQEAIAFGTAADAAFDDLRDQLAKRDPARTAAVGVEIDRLSAVSTDAAAKKTGVASHDEVEKLGKKIEDQLGDVMPAKWQKPTDDSDYDLIALTLDRMEAAVGAGQRRQAEQARLEAYAFFEFGPERRLKSIDPGLATDVEGLIWFGAKGHDGLAELISKGASRRDLRATRLALDQELEDARATLGDSASRTTVVTNAAIIVFREGLEAVLILAAITASFVGVRRRLRRPVLRRRRARPARERVHLGARADAAAVAVAVRREARGGGRADRHRGAAADHQLVLPPRLLERVDRRASTASGASCWHNEARVGFWSRAGARPARARAHERVPRGLRDRALPAVARAERRRHRGDRGRGARPRR